MTVAQTDQTIQFDTALRTLAARAVTRYPGEQARINKALVIALNQGVTLLPDGSAHVKSQSDSEIVYEVRKGQCDCPDFSRAPVFCKHKMAVSLTKKAMAQLASQPAKRIAYHAHYHEAYGQAIRDAQGGVWFFGENDTLTKLTDADMVDLHLHGRVDVAADQRRRDLDAGTDLSRLDALTSEATILHA